MPLPRRHARAMTGERLSRSVSGTKQATGTAALCCDKLDGRGEKNRVPVSRNERGRVIDITLSAGSLDGCLVVVHCLSASAIGADYMCAS